MNATKKNNIIKYSIFALVVILLILIINFGVSKFKIDNEKDTEIMFNELRIAQSEINLSTTDYTEGSVKIKITTNKPGLTPQYKIGEDGEWKDYTDEFEVTENGEVHTRLVGEDFIGPETIKEVDNLYVAKIGETLYGKLSYAISACSENAGDTQTKIEMIADVTESTVIGDNKNIIIDLCGKSIKPIDNNGITVNNGKLQIIDSVGNGELGSEFGIGVYLNDNSSTVTIGENDGNVSTTNPVINGKTYGVFVDKNVIENATLNFYDGIISGETESINTDNVIVPDGYGVVRTKNNNIESAILKQGYVITYNLNGGEGNFKNQFKVIDEPITLLNDEPTKQGNIFLGWSTTQDGTQVQYNKGDIYNINANLNLYAVWELEKIKVTFDKNYVEDTLYEDSTNISKFSGSAIKNIEKIQNENVTKGNIIKFTMNENSDGKIYFTPKNELISGQTYTWSMYIKSSSEKSLQIGVEGSQTKTVTIGEEYTNVTMEFTANENGKFVICVADNSTFADGDEIYIHSLDLKKEKIQNTIKNIEQNSQIGELPILQREGYEFLGWYTLPMAGIKIDETEVITEKTTYYAHWKINKYLINYNANGADNGSVNSSTHMYDDIEKLNKNNYSKTGYTFKEWNTKEDGTGISYTDEQEISKLTSELDGVINLYAQWEDTTPPTTNVPTGTSTTCTIEVTCNQTDNGAGIESVQYGISENGTTWRWQDNNVFEGLEDGKQYYIKTKAKDKQGNESESDIATISTIEIEMGTIIFTKENASGEIVTPGESSSAENLWVNSNIYISLVQGNVNTTYTVTDLEQNTVNVTENVLSENTGIYIVTVKSTDGTNTKSKLYYLFIDKTVPEIIEVNNSSNGNWTKEDVLVKLKAKDENSGIYAYEYYDANTQNWVRYENSNKTEFNVPSFTEQTETEVSFRCIDNAGNISLPVTTLIKIDKTNPIAEITKNNGGEYNISVNEQTVEVALNVVASDEGGSNVSVIKYGVSNSLETQPDIWKECVNGEDFNVELNGGDNYVYIKVIDVAGNETIVTSNKFDVGYTVEYNLLEGTSQIESQVKKHNINLTLSDSIPEKLGYEFKGWTTIKGSKNVQYESGAIYEENKSIILYAVWSPIEYTITYNLNGGTIDSESITKYTIETESFTLNIPEKTGYTFKGWTGSNGDNLQITVEIQKGSSGNKEYTANYNANNYTIKYDGNGSTFGEMEDLSCTYDIAQKLSANIFEKTGYTFMKWNTKPDGTGTNYENEEEVLNLVTKANGEIILYACWEDLTLPTVTKPTGVATTNTITVNCNQTDDGLGISGVEYGIYKDGEWKWQESNIFEGLAPNTEYEIKTRVKENTKEDTWIESESALIKTEDLGNTYLQFTENNESGNAIIASNTQENKVWTNNDIYVKINKKDPEGVTSTYKVNDGESKDSNSLIETQTGEYVIVLETTDGINTTKTIYYINVDKINPTATIENNGGEYIILANNSAVDVSTNILAQDNESGVNTVKYAWSVSNEQQPDELGWTVLQNNTQIVKSLEGGTYYLWVKVTDNAGNELISVSEPYYINYEIKYNKNGAVEDFSTSDKKVFNEDIIIKDNVLTKPGYVHMGWNTSAEGTGVHYDFGSTYKENSAIELFAQWETAVASCTIDGNVTYYMNVQDAINSSENNTATITILKTSVVENIVVNENQNITLDLNGKTLSSNTGNGIENSGTLIITDSIGTGVLSNSANSVILNKLNSSLTINNITINSTGNNGIVNDESATNAKIVINSGNINVTASDESNQTTISAIKAGAGNVTINGGTINVDSNNTGKTVYSINSDSANVDITSENAVIHGTINALNGSNVTIENGIIDNGNENMETIINTSSNVTIKNGTMKNTQNDKPVILNTSNSILQLGVSQDGIPNINKPLIEGKYTGISNTAVVNFYDGIVKGEQNSITGGKVNSETGYIVIYGEETISENTIKTATLGISTPIIKAKHTDSTGSDYTSGEWTNDNIYIEIETINPGDGITNYYKIGENGEWQQIETENNKSILVITDNMNDTIYFKAKNANFESEIESINIKKETTLPVIQIENNGGEYVINVGKTTKEIIGKITVTDEGGSGLNKVEYGFSTSNEVQPTSWEECSNEQTITKQVEGGNYYLFVSATDIAGNKKVEISNMYKIGYEIKYNNNGGEGNIENQVKWANDELIITTEEPTKLGYEFKGWSKNSNSQNVDYAKSSKYTENESIELYAVWGACSYNINYNLNGGINNELNKQKYEYGEGATLYNPTKNGYEFDGWYTNEEFTDLISNISSTQIGDITVYAKWNIIEYSINYILDGGSVNGTNPTKYTVETDDITLINPSKTGYTFKGWLEYGKTNVVQNVVITKGSTGNKKYTAQWKDETPPTTTPPTGTPTSSKITVISNQTDDGSGIDKVQYSIKKDGEWSDWQDTNVFEGLDKNTEYEIKTKATDKEGNTSESEITTVTTTDFDIGTITIKEDSENGKIINASTDSENVTWINTNLYIKLEQGSTENTTYKVNGTTYTQNTIIETENGEYIIELITTDGTNEITKTYYINVDKTAPNAELNPNGGKFVIGVESTDITLNSEITATDEGGSGIKTIEYAWSTSNETQPTQWVQTINNSQISNFTEGGKYYVWTKVIDNAGNENVQVSNEFNVIYEIKYNTNNAIETSIQNQEKVKDVDINLLSTKLTKENYVHNGWNTKNDGTGTHYDLGETYTENKSIVLYAQWTKAVAKITYNGVTTYYETLQNAINDAGTTLKTIELISSVTETVNIDSNKNVIIDLAGKQVNSISTTITNNGTLQITDTVGNGCIQSTLGSSIENNGSLEIKNGTIKGKINAIKNTTSGNVTVENGTVIGDANGINSNGSVIVKGGVIESTTGEAIKAQAGSVTLGENDEIVKIDSPKIKGKTNGIDVNSEVEFNFYDGVITAEDSTIVGNINNMPTGYNVQQTEENGIKTAILVIANYQNTTTGSYFEKLNVAIENSKNANIQNPNTIKVLNSTQETTTSNILETQKFILNLNGKTVTLNGAIISNNGTLEIENSQQTGELTSINLNTIKNTGTLTILSGTVNNTGNGVTIANTGITTVSGGVVNSSGTSNTIENDGTLTISGSTVSCSGSGHTIINLNNKSDLVINNGAKVTNTSTSGYAISSQVTDSTIKIDGTETLISSYYRGIYLSNNVELRMTSGKVDVLPQNNISANPIGIRVTGTAVANIEGGTISCDEKNLSTENRENIISKGITVDGGTLNIGEPGNLVNVTNPCIFGDDYGIALNDTNQTTKSIKFYDGVIKGKTAIDEASLGVTITETGYSICYSKETINSNVCEVATLGISAPIITAKEVNVFGKDYISGKWINKDVYIKLNTDSPGEGVTYYYKIGENGEWNELNTTDNEAEITITDDMDSKIYFKSKNSNFESSESNIWIRKDTKKPQIQIVPNGNSVEKNENITIKITENGGSNLSNSNSYEYYLSTSETVLAGGSWKTYTPNSSFNIGSGLNGTRYLWVKQVKDNAGNSSNYDKSIDNNYYVTSNLFTFDNLAPTVDITAQSYAVNNEITIKAQDEISGIIYWGVTTTNSEPEKVSSTNTYSTSTCGYWYPVGKSNDCTLTFIPKNAGTYYIWVEDFVGNGVSKYARKFTVGDANYKIERTNIYYTTLSQAVRDSQDNDTITVIKDNNDSGEVTINKNLTINLNGKTITKSNLINIDSDKELNINSSGKITSSASNTLKNNGTIILNNSNAILENTYSSIGGSVVYNNGTVKIITGNIISTNGSGIYNNSANIIVGEKGGVPSIEQPEITGLTYGIINNGNVELYDGVIKGKNAELSGKVNKTEDNYICRYYTEDDYKVVKLGISKPIITAKFENGTTYNSGDWTNENVYVTLTIDNPGNGVTYYWKEGETGEWKTSHLTSSNNIGKITFTSNRNETIYFKAQSGIFESEESSIIIRKETEGPTATLNPSAPVAGNNVEITLTDKSSGVSYWAITDENVAPTNTSSTITTSSNTLNCWYPVENAESVVVTFKPSDTKTYYIWAKDGVGNGATEAVKTFIPLEPNWYNETKQIYYTNLTNAANDADSGNILNLLKNPTEVENETAVISKNVKINLQGYTLTRTAPIVVNKGITLSFEQGTGKITASGGNTITNNGTLKINTNIEVENTSNSTSYYTINNIGTLQITNGTVIATNKVAVNNTGTLTLGTSGGVPSSDSPVVQGLTYGIKNSGTFNFYDGIVKGVTDAISGTVTKTEEKYCIVYGTENIGSNVYKTATLGISAPIISAKLLDGTTYNSGDWSNQNIVVTLSCESPGEGITQYYWKVEEGGTWQTKEINMATSTITFTVNRDNTIYFKAKNNNFESGTSSIIIRKEDVVPTITVSPELTDKVCKNKDVTITVADKGGSGLSSSNNYRYYLSTSNTKLSGGSWMPYTSGTSFNIGDTITGERYLWIDEISDTAGNVISGTVVDDKNYTVKGPFIFDNKGPTIALNNNDFVQGNKYLATLTDTVSGIEYWGITTKNTEPETESSTVVTDTSDTNIWYKVSDSSVTEPVSVKFSANESGEFYIWAKDSAGNVSYKQINILKANYSEYNTSGTFVKNYALLNSATQYSGNGNTIKPLANITETTGVEIPATKNIILDLDGKTITLNNVTITNNGTATISGGTLTSSGSSDTIENDGNLTVSGATINSTGSGHTIINLNNKANLVIKDGAKITNTSTSGYALSSQVAGSTIKIEGTNTLISSYYRGIYLSSTAELTMESGQVAVIPQKDVVANPIAIRINETAVANIKGGSVGCSEAVLSTASRETIVSKAIVVDGGILNIGVSGGSVSETNPSIFGDDYGVSINDTNQTTKAIRFYDGVIKGNNAIDTIGLGITTTQTGYNICYSKETINGNVCEVATLGIPVAKIGLRYFKTVQNAFDFVEDNTQTKVDIVKTHTTNSIGTVSSGKIIILDLNGNTITATNGITNNGTLVFRDTTGGGAVTSSNSAVTNNGVFKVQSGKIITTGEDHTIINNSELTVSGGTVISGTSGQSLGTSVHTIYSKTQGATTIVSSGTIQNYRPNGYTINIQGADSTLTISSATITSVYRGIYISSNVVLTMNSGTITVNGSNKRSADQHPMGIRINSASAKAYIKGGTIECTDSLNGENAKGICLDEGTLELGTDGGTPSVTSPTIMGTDFGVGTYTDTAGTDGGKTQTIKFYDGKLVGKVAINAVGLEKVTTQTGYNICYSKETINGNVCEVATLGIPVAKIGLRYFKTVQNAFDFVEDNTQTKVDIVKTHTTNSIGTVSSGKIIILDLNGNTITATNGITNNGTLVFRDTTGGGAVTSSNSAVTNNGVFKVQSGKIITTGEDHTIINNSELTVSGGTVISGTSGQSLGTSVHTIYSKTQGATTIVSSGTIQNYRPNGYTINIQGADSTLTISSATITSVYRGIYISSNVVLTMNSGTITVNGSNKRSADQHPMGIRINSASAKAYIKGGTIECTDSLNGENAKGICLDEGTLELGTDGGTPSVTSPTIMGTDFGVGTYTDTAGTDGGKTQTIKFYDGKLVGKVAINAVGLEKVTTQTGYNICYSKETINGTSYEVATLGKPVCKIGNRYYTNLQDAIDYAGTNTSTITMLKNVNLQTTVATISSNQNIKLDLSGYTLNSSSGSTIVNKGSLQITSSGSTGGKINNTSTSNIAIIENSGTLNLSNQTMVTENGRGILTTSGTVKIAGTSITSKYATVHITGASTVNISNGATITSNDTIGVVDESTTGTTTVNINTATINAGTHGIKANIAKVNITAVEINAGAYGILVGDNATLTLGNSSNTPNETRIKINGTTRGVSSTGTFNYYDGKICGTDAINGTVTSVPTNYGVQTVKGETATLVIKNYYNNTTGSYFAELSVALDNVNTTGDTIEASAKTISETKTATLETGNTVTLKLNSSTIISFSGTSGGIVNNGKLTISGNSGTITASGKNTITNNSDGVLNVNKAVLKNTETLTSNTTAKGKVIYNAGTCTCSNSTTITSNYRGVENSATGTLTINSCTITSKEYAVLNRTTSSNTAGVTITGSSKVTINDTASTESNSNSAVYNYSTGKVLVSGSTTINSTNCGIVNNSTGTVEVDGATIVATSYGIYSNGTVKVISGSVKSESNHGIGGNNQIVTIGSSSATLSNTNPIIMGELKGIYMSGGTLQFYNGIIKGKKVAYDKNAQTVVPRTGYMVVWDSESTYTSIAYLEQAIAAIGTTQYSTIAEAVEAAKSGDEIDLLRNATSGNTLLDVPSTKNVIFDLNGYTLKSTGTSPVVNNNGTLTIKNSKSSTQTAVLNSTSTSGYTIKNNGTLTLQTGINVESSYKGIYNDTSGCLTINGTTINATNMGIESVSTKINTSSASSGNAVYIYGNTKITSENSNCIYNNSSGKVIISNGTYNQTSGGSSVIANNSTGVLSIGGGTINNNSSTKYAVANISTGNVYYSGGTINCSSSGEGIYNKTTGKIYASGGTITCTGSGNGIYNNSGGTISQSGTTINTASGSGIYSTSGTVNVSDGQITSSSGNGIYNNTSTITMSGGKVYGKNGIWNAGNGTINISGEVSSTYVKATSSDGIAIRVYTGSLNLTGGNIMSNYRGITVSGGTVTFGSSSSNFSSTNPSVVAEDYGYYDAGTSTFKFYAGEIYGRTDATNKYPTTIRSGMSMTVNESDGYKRAYLDSGVAKVGTRLYGSLQTALSSASSGSTIELIDNVSEGGVTVPSGKTFTLNTSSYTITLGSETLENNGTLTLSGSGTITGTSSVITNNGTLTVSSSSIKIKGTGNGSAIVNKKKLTVSGGTITSTGKAIYDNKTANTETYIKGGTISNTSTSSMKNISVNIQGSGSKLVISGGTISGNYRCIHIGSGATLTMTGGGVNVTATNLGTSDPTIIAIRIVGGTANITRASITASKGSTTYAPRGMAVESSGTLTFGANGDSTTPVIVSDAYGINISSSTVNMYGGTVKGKTRALSAKPNTGSYTYTTGTSGEYKTATVK